MAISVSCEDCGYELRARDEHAGRRVRCPDCSGPIEVPAPRRSGSRPKRRPAAAASRSASPARSGASRNSGRSGGQRKRNSQSSPYLVPGLIGGGVALLLIIGLVVFLTSGGNDETNTTASNFDGNPMAVAESPANPPAVAGVVATATPVTQPVVEPAPGNIFGSPDPAPQAGDPVNTAAVIETDDAGSESDLSLADVNELIEPSVVRIETIGYVSEAQGSGYVIDESGLVLTNHHVISDARAASVVFSDGYRAPVTGIYIMDKGRDVALIQINAAGRELKALKFADGLPRKGESVVTLGAPLGLSFTLTQGIISAIRDGKDMDPVEGNALVGQWLQTTAQLSPGSSGGPLVNRRGEVVGMNAWTHVFANHLSFAISVDDVKYVMAQPRPEKPAPLRPTPPRIVRIPGVSPQIPPRSTPRPSPRPSYIDVVGTKEGDQFLAALKQVVLLKVEISFGDHSGKVKTLLEAQAQRALKSVDVDLITRRREIEDPGVMLMALGFDDASKGTAGTQEMSLQVMIMWSALDKDGRRQVYKIYDKKESIGTFSASALSRGIIPRNVATNVSKYFSGFTSSFRKAQRLSGG